LLSKFGPDYVVSWVGFLDRYRTDRLTSVPPALRYDVATLYMQQADWDFDAAIEAYKEDERWEKEHPMQAREKGKKAKSVGMRRFVGSSANAAGAAR
jgi:hypothetical protein